MVKVTKLKKLQNKTIRWLRLLHRDLGFLFVGITLVYAISGIYLNHMDGKDPAFVTEEYTLEIAKNIKKEDFSTYWNRQENLPKLMRVLTIDSEHIRLMLDGGIGVYNKETGIVDYETHQKKPFVYWINKLHYNKLTGWKYIADLFAGVLIFFALSGLFIVRGKKGILGRGKWYLIIGILLPILYVLFS